MKNLIDVERVETLSKKMNKITEKLKENLDIADDLDIQADDIIDYVDQTVSNITEVTETTNLPQKNYLDLINLNILLEDFAYIRNTLRANTDNGQKIIKIITTDILSSDAEELTEKIAAYSELNRSLTDSMKLFIQAYKDISNIILNLEKVKQGLMRVENNLNINNFGTDGSDESIKTVVKTTAEIIEKLREQNKK